MPPARTRRWALTRTFAVVSLVAVLLLGAALVLTVDRVMRDQALGAGATAAESVAAYVTDSLDPDVFIQGVLPSARRDALEQDVAGFSGQLVAMRIWTVDGTLLYDSRPENAANFPDTTRLDNAIIGDRPDAKAVTETIGGAGSGLGATRATLLDVYVGISYGSTKVGAAEVMLDYTQTATALRAAVRNVTLVIIVGLVVLWVLLFRTVRSASRRLQVSALENARLALLDPLTGLPNRRMLLDRMRKAADQAALDGSGVGMVLLDIDRFKDINDSLGHDLGDELLVQVAHRLRAALRERDVVARLGGDEFAILLPAIRSVANAERLAQRVRNLFMPAFKLGELELHVDSSIGVACIPEHADDVSTLMRKADVAMYAAKTHRLGVAIYSPDADDSSPARLVLLGDLHRALEATGELVMHYQPKIDLSTGDVVGYEALMRWQHPTRGMLVPDLFIPLAEQSGLITDLTDFALGSVVDQVAAWDAEGLALPVAVNLSAHNITSMAVVDTIIDLLSSKGLDPALLEVEITETALVADPSRVVPVLQRLSTIGVRVSIDDFGIGNTSISQLRDMPVSRLKIDRVFVADLNRPADQPGSSSVVKAMVDLAHSFGLEVVAEGVEDSDTEAMLRELGADQAQGFLYSQAVRAEQVTEERRAARGVFAGGGRGSSDGLDRHP